MRGVVVAYDALDGSGTIEVVRGGERYFVHRTAIKAGDVTDLQVGQKIDFEVLAGRYGKQAVDVVPVKLVSTSSPAAPDEGRPR